jgi:hypothetical protein
MKRCLEIAVFGVLCVVAAGCNPPEQEPIWEHVKIDDLAPWKADQHAGFGGIKSIGFSVYVFEAPLGRIEDVSGIWDVLVGPDVGGAERRGLRYGGRIRFNSYDAFTGNSFSIGLGGERIWPRFAGVLNAAGARKIQTLSILVTDDGINEVPVGMAGRPQTVFYVKSDGAMDAVGVGPGRFALQIRAQRIPGFRGLCNVDVQPAFSTGMRPGVAGPGGLGFSSVGFSMKMSPGEFFVLGPSEVSSNGLSLSSYLFERSAPSSGGRMFLAPSPDGSRGAKAYFGPVVRVYMVVCTSINN